MLSEGRAVDVRPLPKPSVRPGALGKVVLGRAETGALVECCVGLGKMVTGLGSPARGKFKVGFTSAFSALVVIVTAGAVSGGTDVGFTSVRCGMLLAAGASILGAGDGGAALSAGAGGAAGFAITAGAGALGDAATRSPGKRMPQNPGTASVNSSST